MGTITLQPYSGYPNLTAIDQGHEAYKSALTSIKETLEEMQRRGPNVLDSVIRVQDLIDLQLATLDGNDLTGVTPGGSGPDDLIYLRLDTTNSPLTGALTIQGLLTAQAGITVNGGPISLDADITIDNTNGIVQVASADPNLQASMSWAGSDQMTWTGGAGSSSPSKLLLSGWTELNVFGVFTHFEANSQFRVSASSIELGNFAFTQSYNIIHSGDNVLLSHTGAGNMDLTTGIGNVLANGNQVVTEVTGDPESGDVLIYNPATGWEAGPNIADASVSEINTQNGNYTLIISDAGKTLYKVSGAGNTWTIPANTTVAFAVGTMIALTNDSDELLTIAINTDTLEDSNGNTGTQYLPPNTSALLKKVTTTKWRFMNGTVNGIAALNVQNGNYTLQYTDIGKTILKQSGGAGETWTIPANSVVAFPVGTMISFDNDGGGDLTIAINTDTLEDTTGTQGSQVLGDNNTALIKKITQTKWRYYA